MAIALTNLVAETDRLLDAARISDYCPNGLQVEGRPQVRRIVSGVTASQALIDAAIAAEADVLLVHHGYFWKGEDARVVGSKQRRLKALLAHDISLLAYHLPLDVHAELGNNVQLAHRLGIEVEDALVPGNPKVIGLQGSLPQPLLAGEFAARVEQVLGRAPLLVNPQRRVSRIGWCSGGGQGYIEQAIAAGVDLFLTGEASEQTYHSAVENDIAFIAAGHHATERYGVQALGEYLASHFALEHRFIDCPNPI
ncbi:Nif3-like dinuclear metal center hexameric protein [Pseudomonas fluvialis]|jgi:dinuclear metal center YbgI/SA1388 family protein|uniref:GTP cyclohydrolase 1 type 2 homolog n=1 Tax=Pseudomonas fluvialis TaxID=1793966 RepID=A0A2I0CLT1_9PSED|nr:Nif3-like dinuclear metal center hexameric protein [Pseudomonas pharmacofabricae]MBP8262732.1 Nif3-like dinuclear metal center hexameric protein [Pseudomonas sp.]PKF70094.1 Nif3-like dinuclear metal center hexameric protein [Pseudomonas pharmacofabricae]